MAKKKKVKKNKTPIVKTTQSTKEVKEKVVVKDEAKEEVVVNDAPTVLKEGIQASDEPTDLAAEVVQASTVETIGVSKREADTDEAVPASVIETIAEQGAVPVEVTVQVQEQYKCGDEEDIDLEIDSMTQSKLQRFVMEHVESVSTSEEIAAEVGSTLISVDTPVFEDVLPASTIIDDPASVEDQDFTDELSAEAVLASVVETANDVKQEPSIDEIATEAESTFTTVDKPVFEDEIPGVISTVETAAAQDPAEPAVEVESEVDNDVEQESHIEEIATEKEPAPSDTESTPVLESTVETTNPTKEKDPIEKEKPLAILEDVTSHQRNAIAKQNSLKDNLYNLITCSMQTLTTESTFEPIDPSSKIDWGITKIAELKRITIAFRGNLFMPHDVIEAKKITSDLLSHVIPNPNRKILQEFQGVSIYHSFFECLFHDEKREGMLLHRILHKVAAILQHCPSYSVSVTGHGSGAALATITSIALAMSDAIPQRIKLITFASPAVGHTNFTNTFKLLAKAGRIQHLRITNDGDLVPNILGSEYPHTGIHLILKEPRWFDISQKQCIFLPYKTTKGSFFFGHRNALSLSDSSTSKPSHQLLAYKDSLEKAQKELELESMDGIYSNTNLFSQYFKGGNAYYL